MYSSGSGGGGSRQRPRDVWISGSGDSGGRGHGDDKKDEDDRKPSASIPEGAEVIDLLDDDSDTDADAGGDDGGDDTRKPSSQAHVSASPRRRNAASSPPPRSRRRRRDNRDHNHPTSLFAASSAGTSAASMSSNTTNTNISSSSNSNTASSSDDRGQQHWTCPTCTLHNPLTAALCEACGSLRTGLGVGGLGMQLGGGLRRRTPTPTGRFVGSINRNGAGSSRSGRSDGSGVARRTNGGAAAFAAAREEIVIDDTPPQQRRRTTHHQNNPTPNNPNNANSSPPSAYSYVGGGALLGGMLGATSAYLHGRPLGPAALEGAFAGGVGGAAVNVARSSSAGAAASSASYRRGGGTGGTATAAGGGGAGAYGRGYRVGGGAGGGAGAGHADAYLRHLQNELLRSMAGPPGYHGGRFGGGRYYYGHRAMAPDIDNMTYEQLLARFGDGTENQDRGASAGQIASLPTSTVTNPDDLPNDCRECIVCMENFKRGDVRRTLPCLHSEFHAECVDRWLQSNASCPVCKHQISE